MELRDDQRHVKFYFWCLAVWDAFRQDYTWRQRTNLCHYLRTMFVWMPLAILSHLAILYYAYYVFLGYPLATFGTSGTGSLYLFAALIAGAIFGVVYLRQKLRERERERYFARIAAEDDEVLAIAKADQAESKGPGFFEVVWLFLVAQKQRFCPTIEFRPGRRGEGV